MKKNSKIISAAMMGNALEYYDVTLYGFFAVYLSPLYFPAENPLNSMIASFGAFAAGFLTRPLGGLIFGHLGDRYGRRIALLTSVWIVMFPTLIIGLLPTYDQIGFWAPLIIVLCRMAQGMCTAGEYTGATVLIAEYTEHARPGFTCSILPASSLTGALLGTILGAICLMDVMPSWAWRMPFILGFVFGLCTLFLRREIGETPAFTNLSKHHEITTTPVLEILKNQRRNFFCTIGIGITNLAPFYMISVYINSLTTKLDISASAAMFLNVGVLLLWIIFLPTIGYFSDKVGLKRMMSYGALLLMVVSLPIFYFINHNISLTKILIAQVILSLCGSLFNAPMGAFLATKFFPTAYRYSGIALGISFGEALFGGTAPLIAAGLVLLTGALIAPGFYLMFCGLIGLISVNYYQPITSEDAAPRRRESMKRMEYA